jgi:hypothetical protein
MALHLKASSGRQHFLRFFHRAWWNRVIDAFAEPVKLL